MTVLIFIVIALASYLLIRRPRSLTQPLLSQLSQQNSRLQVGDVVQVSVLPKRYARLPLGTLGFLREVNDRRGRVRFFDLTPGGELDYTSAWHDLSSLRRANESRIREIGQENYDAAKAIAPLLMKRWELDLEHQNCAEEISLLKKHRRKVKELLNWVEASEINASYESEYRSLLAEIDYYWNQAAELRQEYMHLVKEIIISNELIEYDRKNSRRHTPIKEESQRLEREVEQLKQNVRRIDLSHVLQP
jgi:hypothetical protein